MSRSVVVAQPPRYTLCPTPFGELVLVWREEAEGALLQRLYLPRDGASPLPRAQAEHAGCVAGEHPGIGLLGAALVRGLRGGPLTLALAQESGVALDLPACPAFQQRVLLAEAAVPRGYVTTYGRLAAHLGAPQAARAVGAALAHNPFPLLIPCHRALRGDLSLGGFQGGLAMKAALLTMEGHTVVAGRVLANEAQLWYGAQVR